MFNRPKIGDRVTIRNTILHDGRKGILQPSSSSFPDQLWEYSVDLGDIIIGVTRKQIKKA
jgi:hypothetical protein